ncbi:MAG: hypothetical protein NXH82_08510 [Rhodobacteraceae bacterium]|nr:hypothetical protein [Paracoccaceae bacterium]
MPELMLTDSHLTNGVWQATVSGTPTDSGPPALVVRLGPDPIEDVRLTRRQGGWRMEVDVPVRMLSDGAHTLTARDAATDRRLGQITVVAGTPPHTDLQGDVALLRAELDLLKRAFRRHCDPDADAG